MIDRAFWARQRVLLTGHTGFKGSWASLWLESMGATVAGYALAPDQSPALYPQIAPFSGATSEIGDLADAARLAHFARDFRPTLVLHMAAQPLVSRSYADPAATFLTNVQGTVNLLEAVRGLDDVTTVLIVTTDKVYDNPESGRRFVETDRLGGHDPYSASKAACEIAVASYAACFFEPRNIPVATGRAGNVLGGGDWSEDRLVPELWRARRAEAPVALRYPRAYRPWQHVLEPLSGYFVYLQRLAQGADGIPRALNFGPAADADKISVSEVIEIMQQHLGSSQGWIQAEGEFPPEMRDLALDSETAMRSLGWHPRLSSREAMEWTAEWYERYDRGETPRALMAEQIAAYEART